MEKGSQNYHVDMKAYTNLRTFVQTRSYLNKLMLYETSTDKLLLGKIIPH